MHRYSKSLPSQSAANLFLGALFNNSDQILSRNSSVNSFLPRGLSDPLLTIINSINDDLPPLLPSDSQSSNVCCETDISGYCSSNDLQSEDAGFNMEIKHNIIEDFGPSELDAGKVGDEDLDFKEHKEYINELIKTKPTSEISSKLYYDFDRKELSSLTTTSEKLSYLMMLEKRIPKNRAVLSENARSFVNLCLPIIHCFRAHHNSDKELFEWTYDKGISYSTFKFKHCNVLKRGYRASEGCSGINRKRQKIMHSCGSSFKMPAGISGRQTYKN